MAADYKSYGITLTLLLPLYASAAGDITPSALGTQIWVVSAANTLLVITSVISIIQFITHKHHNRTPFQLFNIVFAVVFYSVSIPFLLHNKEFFTGFENLSDQECLKKYFLDTDLTSWIRRIIPVAVIMNLIYLIRFARTYYLE